MVTNRYKKKYNLKKHSEFQSSVSLLREIQVKTTLNTTSIVKTDAGRNHQCMLKWVRDCGRSGESHSAQVSPHRLEEKKQKTAFTRGKSFN